MRQSNFNKGHGFHLILNDLRNSKIKYKSRSITCFNHRFFNNFWCATAKVNLSFQFPNLNFRFLFLPRQWVSQPKSNFFFARPTPLRLFFSALLRLDLNCCALDIYIVVIVYLCIPVSKPGNVRWDPVTLPWIIFLSWLEDVCFF